MTEGSFEDKNRGVAQKTLKEKDSNMSSNRIPVFEFIFQVEIDAESIRSMLLDNDGRFKIVRNLGLACYSAEKHIMGKVLGVMKDGSICGQFEKSNTTGQILGYMYITLDPCEFGVVSGLIELDELYYRLEHTRSLGDNERRVLLENLPWEIHGHGPNDEVYRFGFGINGLICTSQKSLFETMKASEPHA